MQSHQQPASKNTMTPMEQAKERVRIWTLGLMELRPQEGSARCIYIKYSLFQ